MRPPCGSVAISPCMNPRPCLFDLQHKPVCQAEPPRKAGRWKNIFLSNHSRFPQSQKKVEAPPTTHAGQGSQQTQRRILNSCKYVNTRGTGSQVTTIKGCDRFSDVFTIKMNLQVNINFMSPKSYSLRRPRATDGYALNQLVKRCPPLDTNSVYCNLLQCSDFSATGIAAEDSQGELVGFISGYR